MSRLLSSHKAIAGVVGLLSFVVRVPFLFRYDLNFADDSAICYLMALRITQGDRPLYFYGQDYQGAPEAYVAALLLQVFGSSIPIAAVVSLFEWSLAAAVGTYLVTRGTNAFVGTVCGLAVVLGVPFTLHYVTVPYWGYPGSLLISMCLLLQAFLILERGPSIRRLLIFGGTAGFGLYVGKQCVPAVVAAVLVMSVSSLRSARPPKRHWALFGVAGFAGFLGGYSPELWYRLHATTTRSFVATFDSSIAWQNAKFTVVSLLAYFNAHPVSRTPYGTNFFGHFYSHLPDSSVFPNGALDWLFALVAMGAVLLAFASLWKARKNPALLLLASMVFINLAAVVLSNDTNGLFLATRRYLFPSAIALSIWGGFLVALAWQSNQPWARAAAVVISVLFAGKVLTDEYSLLRAPDELGELRQIADQLNTEGIHYGIAPWHTYELSALTNQRLTMVRSTSERIPEYVQIASRSDRIAVLSSRHEPLQEFIQWNGADYDRAGPPHESEILRWTLYRKRPLLR